MTSLGEILRADPDKIKFDGGRPPVIGEVPPHTYGMLLTVDCLGLLDEPEDISAETTPTELVLSREEELRRELQSISARLGIPVFGTVEKPDQTTVFEFKPKTPTPEDEPEKNDIPKKQHLPPPQNKKNRSNNMKIFSGRLGKTIFEKGAIVNRKR